MLRLHRGRIVFISSVGAFVGLPGQANYAASKAGLVGMARALAREVASRPITVNVVAPGVVATDMIAALGDERFEQLRAHGPVGADGRRPTRWPTPSASWPPTAPATSPGPSCRSTAAWAWVCEP